MASVIDYSKFDAIGAEEEAEERAKREAVEERRRKRKAALGKSAAEVEEMDWGLGGANALRPPAKYVDSDGETVSGPSDDEDSSDDDDDDDDEPLHPLFWTKMPKPGSKEEPYAEILENMVYKNDDDEDKTPNELAVDFKDKGNDFFKWGPNFYKRALKEYKEGLHWARRGDDSPENRTCYAAILSNRAAINLKLRNYRSVVRDCEAALKFGPDPPPNCKPHYRAAQALHAVDRPKEALAHLKSALKLDPENKAVAELKAKVDKQLAARKKEQLAKERKMLQERRLDEAMRKACLARGITMGPLVSDIELYTSNAVGNKTQGGFPRPGYEDDSMQWPVLLMVPETMQTDFIQAFDLRHTFRDHLQMMFPASQDDRPSEKQAPWDEAFNYTVDALEVYFEEREVEAFDMTKMWASQYGKRPEKVDYSKRLRVKVGLDKTLLQAISDPNFVVAGVPTFYLVSTRSSFYRDTFVPQHEGRNRIL